MIAEGSHINTGKQKTESGTLRNTASYSSRRGGSVIKRDNLRTAKKI